MNPFLQTAAVALLLLVPFATATAQGDPEAKPRPKVEKLGEWPVLKDADKDRVLAMVGQFRKADPALHDSAQKQLLTLGEPAIPLLFQQVTDHADNVNDKLFPVFDTLLEPKHAALMVREAKKPKVELRRYLVQRLSRFTDPDLLPVLVATAKDKDPETAFYGALGALALKHGESLPAVLAYSKTRWKAVAPLVAEVLPNARSNEAGSWVFAAIAKAPVPDQMAGLRVARYLAVKDHLVILRTYLGASDHTVKKEAVNVARVLHGEEPIENLDVFKSIEMAKEWLGKI